MDRIKKCYYKPYREQCEFIDKSVDNEQKICFSEWKLLYSLENGRMKSNYPTRGMFIYEFAVLENSRYYAVYVGKTTNASARSQMYRFNNTKNHLYAFFSKDPRALYYRISECQTPFHCHLAELRLLNTFVYDWNQKNNCGKKFGISFYLEEPKQVELFEFIPIQKMIQELLMKTDLYKPKTQFDSEHRLPYFPKLPGMISAFDRRPNLKTKDGQIRQHLLNCIVRNRFDILSKRTVKLSFYALANEYIEEFKTVLCFSRGALEPSNSDVTSWFLGLPPVDEKNKNESGWWKDEIIPTQSFISKIIGAFL